MSSYNETSITILINDTPCPFAAKATFVDGGSINFTTGAHIDLTEFTSALIDFVNNYESRKIYFIGLEIIFGDKNATFLDCVRAFRTVMFQLNQCDPQGSACLSPVSETPGWQFCFSGVELFTTVFSSFYPKNHSRFVDLDSKAVMIFQPVKSFDFCNVTQHNQAVKNMVRKLFLNRGRPYNQLAIDRRIEAHLYVKPIDIKEDPVRWWISDL